MQKRLSIALDPLLLDLRICFLNHMEHPNVLFVYISLLLGVLSSVGGPRFQRSMLFIAPFSGVCRRVTQDLLGIRMIWLREVLLSVMEDKVCCRVSFVLKRLWHGLFLKRIRRNIVPECFLVIF